MTKKEKKEIHEFRSKMNENNPSDLIRNWEYIDREEIDDARRTAVIHRLIAYAFIFALLITFTSYLHDSKPTDPNSLILGFVALTIIEITYRSGRASGNTEERAKSNRVRHRETILNNTRESNKI